MKWVSALEVLPLHGEEVLIQLDDDYALARFDVDKEEFYVMKYNKRAKIDQLVVHWMRLEPPK